MSQAKEVLARLWPHQTVGVRFLLKRKHVLLADEMGLGKTVQAVVATELLRSAGKLGTTPHVLVVCKKAHKVYWEDMILEWSVGDPAPIEHLEGEEYARNSVIDRYKYGMAWGYLIMHWDQLRLVPNLPQAGWDVVIADESHKMKSRNSSRSKRLRRLNKTEHIYLLSGTPVTRYVDDLWAQLNMLDPVKFRSYWKFFESYLHYWRHPSGWRKIIGPKDLDQLHREMVPYYLRREKLLNITPVHSVMRAPLEGLQKDLYDAVKSELFVDLKEFQDEGGLLENYDALTRLMRLRRVATSTAPIVGADISGKLDLLEEILEETGESQSLVFGFFRKSVELARDRLRAKGISCDVFMGGSPVEVTRAFQRGDLQVLICTSAGAEGFNFQMASRVLFIEKPWSPPEVQQMIGRVIRPGQRQLKVPVISLLSKGSIDEHVERVLARKDVGISASVVASKVLQELLEE
jgi:SNF2 family DNA or RNA helicase